MKPIFVGLGTAAVLAAGGASAVAAETPSPSPSDSGTTAPSPGDLEVTVEPAAATVDPGGSVGIKTTVKAVGGDAAKVRVSNITAALDGTAITGACAAPFDSAGCSAGDLSSGEAGTVTSTVEVPGKGVKETTVFTVTVTVKATDIAAAGDSTTIKYVVPPAPSPSPTKTPTQTPDDPPSPSKPPPDKPSPTGSSGGGPGGSGGGGSTGGGGSAGGGSSGGSGTGAGAGGSSVSDGGAVLPQPNSSFDAQKPDVALPPIQPPDPAVAPNQSAEATPQSRLQGNRAPVAQDLTFERMASTQVAWLAALLVAFSLLLTQVRLGRRRLRPAGAAAKRLKGAHRRPRRGMFGK